MGHIYPDEEILEYVFLEIPYPDKIVEMYRDKGYLADIAVRKMEIIDSGYVTVRGGRQYLPVKTLEGTEVYAVRRKERYESAFPERLDLRQVEGHPVRLQFYAVFPGCICHRCLEVIQIHIIRDIVVQGGGILRVRHIERIGIVVEILFQKKSR